MHAAGVRPAAVAGFFYAADPARLRQDVESLLISPASFSHRPKALIAPHAGYVYSGAVAGKAFALLRGAGPDITRVVVIGPAHYVALRGISISTMGAFETPLGTVELDRDALMQLTDLPFVRADDAAHAPEHALEVELPFLQMVLSQFRLVPLVVGEATPTQVAAALERLWGGSETLVVISSDLSYYYDYSMPQPLASSSAANGRSSLRIMRAVFCVWLGCSLRPQIVVSTRNALPCATPPIPPAAVIGWSATGPGRFS